jgi:cobalt-zinc-cadmium efflux system membrane fusion protein
MVSKYTTNNALIQDAFAPRMKNFSKILTLSLSLTLISCEKPAEPPPTPEPRAEGESVIFPAGAPGLKTIQSQVVKMQTVPPAQLNGRVTWNEDKTVRVYTPFAGRVERILAQPGQSVAKGQPLATMASPDFGQAQADARRAESDHALAEKNLARVRDLEQNGVAPRKDVHAAEADQARAAAELDRARKRVALYGGDGRGIDSSYTLVSPVSGVVVEKNINPGQELRPDQALSNAPPLYVVTDPASLWIQLDAAEKNLAHLKKGKVVSVRTPAYPEDTFSARVEAVADFLDPVTRTIKVRAALDNTTRKLKSEMFVTSIVNADGESELLVPSRSMYFQGGQNYLFIDEGKGKFTRRAVKAGDVRDNRTEILEGLREGENVVTEGVLMLQQVLKPRRVQK